MLTSIQANLCFILFIITIIIFLYYQYLKEVIDSFQSNFHFHLQAFNCKLEPNSSEPIERDSYFHNRAVYQFHVINYQ